MLENWDHLGRFVEDVSFTDVDEQGNPKVVVMTDEVRALYPDDELMDPTK